MSGFYIGVDGKARKVKGGYIGIDGKARKIKKGYIGDENGIARLCWCSEKKSSEYTVGSSVYLLENGTPVEYIVIHQGLPSTMYDVSCDGTWLMRKDICGNYTWDGTDNDYENSSAKVYVNDVFINNFDATTQGIIKSVKIPYVKGTGNGTVASGANGLSVKLFLLSGYEVGWDNTKSRYFPIDGTCLDYFKNITDDKRVANLNGTASVWWLRSPDTSGTSGVFAVHSNGNNTVGSVKGTYGIRPAFIIPQNASFESTTNILIT